MAVDVVMPKLGESITEATILEWKKSVGDEVSRDETILEISTDKVDSEVPSPESGVLLEILFNKNDVVPVGEVIAKIGQKGENIVEPKANEKKELDSNQNEDSQIKAQEIVAQNKNFSKENKSDRFYSPLVKSIAKKENISFQELESINGTGANGRVNKNDILSYISNKISVNQPISNNIDLDTQEINNSNNLVFDGKEEPMGHVRKMIAAHMIKSRDTSVHVYSSNEVDMTTIVNYRQSNKKSFSDKYNTTLTYTPFILDAVIKAIHDFPMINASINGENIRYNQNVNMGVAVALPDDNLIVPVIKKSEELNFLGLARSTADLALRARKNELSPDEAQGSTFTVTNPGIFGSLFGMGIINQPNVAILSVGAIHKRPVVKETEYGDMIVARSMMYLTLAYDHRIIDGAYGTKFLAKVKELLEKFSQKEMNI